MPLRLVSATASGLSWLAHRKDLTKGYSYLAYRGGLVSSNSFAQKFNLKETETIIYPLDKSYRQKVLQWSER
jgi:hypothetical protein